MCHLIRACVPYVQDADRLDAIGAVGVCRAFTFGAAKNRNRALYSAASLERDPSNARVEEDGTGDQGTSSLVHVSKRTYMARELGDSAQAAQGAAQQQPETNGNSETKDEKAKKDRKDDLIKKDKNEKKDEGDSSTLQHFYEKLFHMGL